MLKDRQKLKKAIQTGRKFSLVIDGVEYPLNDRIMNAILYFLI